MTAPPIRPAASRLDGALLPTVARVYGRNGELTWFPQAWKTWESHGKNVGGEKTCKLFGGHGKLGKVVYALLLSYKAFLPFNNYFYKVMEV